MLPEAPSSDTVSVLCCSGGTNPRHLVVPAVLPPLHVVAATLRSICKFHRILRTGSRIRCQSRHSRLCGFATRSSRACNAPEKSFCVSPQLQFRVSLNVASSCDDIWFTRGNSAFGEVARGPTLAPLVHAWDRKAFQQLIFPIPDHCYFVPPIRVDSRCCHLHVHDCFSERWQCSSIWCSLMQFMRMSVTFG